MTSNSNIRQINGYLQPIGGDDDGALKPMGERPPTFLVDETVAMATEQRLAEQSGHSQKYARVNQRERKVSEPEAGNELSQGLGPKQHPYLDSQLFDGIDPAVSPAPDIATDARREFDNQRREQEKEKQLKLQNQLQNTNTHQNTYSSAPKNRPG